MGGVPSSGPGRPQPEPLPQLPVAGPLLTATVLWLVPQRNTESEGGGGGGPGWVRPRSGCRPAGAIMTAWAQSCPVLLQAGTLVRGAVWGTAVRPRAGASPAHVAVPSRRPSGPWGKDAARAPRGLPSTLGDLLWGRQENREASPEGGRGLPQTRRSPAAVPGFRPLPARLRAPEVLPSHLHHGQDKVPSCLWSAYPPRLCAHERVRMPAGPCPGSLSRCGCHFRAAGFGLWTRHRVDNYPQA